MNRYVVTATRTPTNYNQPTSYIVEAANEDDARAVLKDNLRDLGPYSVYVYTVKPYTPPPAGRVVGFA
jgi:hypothetical protein